MMNEKMQAWFKFQFPHPMVNKICPICHRETNQYLVSCDGHIFETDRCDRHGDVVAIYDDKK